MPFVTYEEIEPLIDHAEHRGNSMVCYFKCPASGKVIEASAGIPGKMTHELKNEAAKGLWRQLLRQVEIQIRKYTGIHMTLGAAASTGHFGMNSIASEGDKKEAIVLAFESRAIYPGKEPRIDWFHNVDGQWRVYTG